MGPCSQRRYLREELLAEQLREAVSRVAISDEWHEAMLEQIDQWREEALDESRATLDRLRKELAEADEKLERLLDLLVDGTLTRDEYALRKEKYVSAKANLKNRIAQSEAKGADWLEPLETFVNRCKQAKRVAFSETTQRRFFAKARPDWVLRYLSKARACYSSVKAIQVLYAHGV